MDNLKKIIDKQPFVREALEEYISNNRQSFIQNLPQIIKYSIYSPNFKEFFKIIEEYVGEYIYKCNVFKTISNEFLTFFKKTGLIYRFLDECVREKEFEFLAKFIFNPSQAEIFNKFFEKHIGLEELWKIAYERGYFPIGFINNVIYTYRSLPGFNNFIKAIKFDGTTLIKILKYIEPKEFEKILFSYDRSDIELVLEFLIVKFNDEFDKEYSFLKIFLEYVDISNVNMDYIISVAPMRFAEFNVIEFNIIKLLYENNAKFTLENVSQLIKKRRPDLAEYILQKIQKAPTKISSNSMDCLNLNLVKLLYKYGTNFSTDNLKKMFYLQKFEIVDFFMSLGIEIDKKTFLENTKKDIFRKYQNRFKFEDSDICFAAQTDVEILKDLIKSGLKPTQNCKKYFIAEWIGPEIVKLLYQNGITFDQNDVCEAASINNYKVVKTLIELGIKPSNECKEVYLKSLEIIKIVYENGITFDEKDLEKVSNFGNLESVKFLINIGIKPKNVFPEILNKIILSSPKSTIDKIPEKLIKNYVKKEFEKGNYDTVLKLTKKNIIPKHLINLDETTENIINSAPNSLYNQNYDFERNMYWYDPKHPRFQGEQKPSFNIFGYWVHDTNDEENLKTSLFIDKEICCSKIHNDDYLLYKTHGTGIVFKGVAAVLFDIDAGSYTDNGYRFQGNKIYGERTEAWVIPTDQTILGLVGNDIKQLNKLSKELNVPVYSTIRNFVEKNELYVDLEGIYNLQSTIKKLGDYIYKYDLIAKKYNPDKFEYFEKLFEFDVKNDKIFSKYFKMSGMYNPGKKLFSKFLIQFTNYLKRIVKHFKNIELEYQYEETK